MTRETGSRVRIAGALGIVGSIAALSLVLASVAYSPWFDWETNALSDLGVGSAAVLFNSGLVIGGVLNFFFALGVRAKLARTSLTNIGTVLLIAGGGSLALVGIFTEELPDVHRAVSVSYFLVFPLAMVLLGIVMSRSSSKGVGAATSLAGLAALGVISTALLAAFGTPVFSVWPEGLAIPELVEALILGGWVILMGARLVANP